MNACLTSILCERLMIAVCLQTLKNSKIFSLFFIHHLTQNCFNRLMIFNFSTIGLLGTQPLLKNDYLSKKFSSGIFGKIYQRCPEKNLLKYSLCDHVFRLIWEPVRQEGFCHTDVEYQSIDFSFDYRFVFNYIAINSCIHDNITTIMLTKVFFEFLIQVT